MTRNILITMIVSTVAALSYRALIWAESSLGWAVFSDSAYEFMSQFDTAIFGVLVSCLVFGLLTLISHLRRTRSN
jgi:hypothetical protein